MITQSTDKPYTSGLRHWVIVTAIIASILSVINAILVSRSVAQPVQSLTVITTAMTVRAAWQMSHRILSILSIWTLLSDGLLV